jgi:hypothetical protein
MDLLKTMLSNRSHMVVHDPAPRSSGRGRRQPTKAERAKAQTAGSRAMRSFIIDEKPSKKVVREHLEAIIAIECESSDED